MKERVRLTAGYPLGRYGTSCMPRSTKPSHLQNRTKSVVACGARTNQRPEPPSSSVLPGRRGRDEHDGAHDFHSSNCPQRIRRRRGRCSSTRTGGGRGEAFERGFEGQSVLKRCDRAARVVRN